MKAFEIGPRICRVTIKYAAPEQIFLPGTDLNRRNVCGQAKRCGQSFPNASDECPQIVDGASLPWRQLANGL
jgi:hypothetical protein